MAERRILKPHRLSLRMLLAALTLTCIALALWSQLVRPYRIERRAATRLEAIGARIATRPGRVPKWLRRLAGDANFQHVVAVHLQHAKFAADDLAVLADLPHVERLYLAASTLDDQGLQHVRHARRLKRISLWKTAITDQGFAVLADLPQLQVVDVHSTALTEACLDSLRGSRSLRRFIHRFPVGDRGLRALASMPNLRDLSIHAESVTDAGLEDFLDAKIHVSSLTLKDSTISDATFRRIAAHPHLRWLRTMGIGLTDQTLSGLQLHPELNLELSDTLVTFGALVDWLEDEVQGEVRWLSLAPMHVRIAPDYGRCHISIRRSWPIKGGIGLIVAMPIGGSDAPSLARLQQLQEVTIGGAAVDEAVFEGLAGLTKLQTLTVSAPLTDEGLRRIGRIEPLTSLTIEGYPETALSPGGLWHLTRLTRLYTLRINSAQLEDQHLEFLQGMPQLKWLTLRGNRLTSRGMAHLAGLASLETLELSFNRELDDAAMEHIGKLRNLRRLIAQEVQVTDAGLEPLHGLLRLESLDLLGSKVTREGIDALRRSLAKRRRGQLVAGGIWMP